MSGRRRCSSDEEEIDPPTPKKKKTYGNKGRKKQFAQHYRKAWESNPELAKWIQEDKTSNTKAKCKICDVRVTADITVLKNHGKSLSHIRKMQSAVVKQPTISQFVRETTTQDKVKSAEIAFASFFAEHNISFNTADHLSDLIKKKVVL